MIGAEAGDVGTGSAILQGQGTGPGLSADDGAAHAGPEGCTGNSGLIPKGLPDAGGGPALQLLTAQHGNRQGGFGLFLVQWYRDQHMLHGRLLSNRTCGGKRHRS